MAKERVWQYRNTATTAEPVWEKYYPKTIADAVLISDLDTEAVNIKEYIDTELGMKVDKIAGKGLSANDYTTEEKNKLASIAAGADVNVQSDWNASSGDAFIKNKPTSLPANGGNAATVGGFTVGCNVPENAKFTDTLYSLPVAGSSLGGVKNGGNVVIDESGKMTAPSAENASTTTKGVVQLSSAVNSTSEALAATSKAVKIAYDLADSASAAASTAQTTATGKATVVFASELPSSAPANSICFLID